MTVTPLNALLAIAFLCALGYALWLRRRLVTQPDESVPPQNPFSPLVEAVAATLDVGLVVLDEERQVRFINPCAEDLLGTERALALEQGLITLIRDYQVDAFVQEVMRDHEAREMTLQQLIGGRVLRLRASSLATGNEQGVVLLIRDVTHLNMLERARRDMVANVSHELRTPLASIKLLVETLQTSPPEHIGQRMLVQTAQEVDAVTQLVNELHDLSQIESGRVRLSMSPTNVAEVISRAIERIHPQAERKSVHVHADVLSTLPEVMIDADRVGQVLLNLLHNAVKFTPAEGRITIQATVIAVPRSDKQLGYRERRVSSTELPTNMDERRRAMLSLSLHGRPTVQVPPTLVPGDWMLVSVTDTGVGIPSRDVPRIFERFYKVDRARTRTSSGTGLGLAIAKHLIEGHGGRIWATSEEGVGSTFFFVLPLA
jgi:two-component system phosphate regulon sensor histidine kinase PhoR